MFSPRQAIVLTALLTGTLAAQDPTPQPVPVQKAEATAAAKKPEKKPIYDESADAKSQIAAALVKAKKEHKRVLIQYGANWCGWCHLLHETLSNQKDRPFAKLVFNEYERVLVDVGQFNKNMDLAAGYGAEIKGIPFLTVLDEDGKVLTNQATDALEDGKVHSVPKVTEFLTRWQVPPVDAENVLAAALERAKKEQKFLFLHFGAPWCGWCHKLEDFLARSDVAPIIALDFIDVKIDEERMPHAKEIEKRFGMPNTGIPWFLFLDGEQNAKATATIPDTRRSGEFTTIGHPSEPHEVAHFVKMLESSVKRISSEQIKFLEKELTAERAVFEAQMKAAKEKREAEKKAKDAKDAAEKAKAKEDGTGK